MESDTVSRRTAVACEECRRKKSKCDGVRPVCTLCQKTQKACHFTADIETRKRKKYNDDYVSSLEDQIIEWKAYAEALEASQPLLKRPDGLEGCPRATGPNHPSPDVHGDTINIVPKSQSGVGRPMTKQPSSGESSGAIQELLNQRSQNAVEEVGAIFWRMQIRDSGETSFIGPSGNFSMSGSSMPLGYQSHHSQLVPHGSAEQVPLFAVFSQDIELKEHLIELFMTHINPLHLFVEVSASFSPADYPHRDLSQQLLHTAIFASGARYAQRKDVSAIGDLLMQHAETIALRCCRNHPSVRVVQALGVLCWRELTYQHDDMAWIYNCMLPYSMLQRWSHFHRKELIERRSFRRRPHHKSWITCHGAQELGGPDNCQKSRRTSLANENENVLVFLLDGSNAEAKYRISIITTLLGRNCSIPMDRIHTTSFGAVLGADATLEEIAFDHQCRLWFLHDKYMDQIYSFDPSKLDPSARDKLLLDARHDLLSFYSTIDSRLQFKKSGMPKSAIFLQMSYQMSVALIHRPYLRESANSSTCTLALHSMTISASSTTRLILIFRKIDTLNNAPPFIIHQILTAAVVHLLNATDTTTDLRGRVSNKLKVCLNALEAMRITWPRAAQAILVVQELAKRWSVVSALPIRFSNVSASNPPFRRPQPPEPPKATATTIHESAEEYRDFFTTGPESWDFSNAPTNPAQWQDESYNFNFDDVYLDQFDSPSTGPEQVVDYNYPQYILDDLHVATDLAFYTGMNTNGLSFPQ